MPIVSNTGPLISACQSQSLSLLAALFDEIHVPSGVMTELDHHGWAEAVSAVSNLRRVTLTDEEQIRVRNVAQEIAACSSRPSPAGTHDGEAEAIVLAQRGDAGYDAILLDELSARSVAQKVGLSVTGFPGVLLEAVRAGRISPDEMRDRLDQCRQQGTHYSESLIQFVVQQAIGLTRSS